MGCRPFYYLLKHGLLCNVSYEDWTYYLLFEPELAMFFVFFQNFY